MGDMEQWFAEHWFDLFSTIGIVGSLWFAAIALRSETKTRRIANFLSVTANYREIWKEFLNQPKLARVLDATANVEIQPVTAEKELFVNMVILHISTTFYAMNDELLMKLEGSRRDIAEFFLLPVPKAVWTKTKPLQNQDFAAFIDSSLKVS
jgi:hypothetical protein